MNFLRRFSEMPAKLVNVTPKDNLLLIGINRAAKKNCVSHETAKQLIAAFDRFERSEEHKVAILYGEGGTFCAGYDLSEVAKGKVPSGQFLEKYRPMGPTKMVFSKPVIAAVEGYAVAGGLEMSLMCDLRVASRKAIFGVFCRRHGVPLIDGGTFRLPKAIGMSRAMDMILTGREVDATTAYEWGLVNRLVDEGKALEEAIKLGKEIAKFPQNCMRADRNAAYFAAYDAKSFEECFSYELKGGLEVIGSESQPGASKFVGRKSKI
uniref:Enoyl-CoA hydratase n=1 Tax=Steinernema glaseri TaxID=37863 RepID=A0A1I8AQ77_9BILA